MTNEVTVAAVRERVDTMIEQCLSERIDSAGEIHPAYARLWRSLRSVVFAGGKRIRPFLTVASYGSLDEKIVPVAAAQELIHVAMLVHDDIIDKDTVRHGAQNMTGIYTDEYGRYLSEAESLHYANSSALLAGDALISEAYQMIASTEFDDAIKQRITGRLSASIFEVIGGELLDAEAGFVAEALYDPITIYRYKTASYSFVGPLLSGAYCRGATGEECELLEKIALNLGIAFQIQDDLLGIYGSEEETGKSTTTDLREGKRTVVIAEHEKRMNDTQKQSLRYFGSPHATREQLEQIKHDIAESGAKQATIELMEQYFEKAAASIEAMSPDAPRRALKELLVKIRERKQ